jgi:hypothetical protein
MDREAEKIMAEELEEAGSTSETEKIMREEGIEEAGVLKTKKNLSDYRREASEYAGRKYEGAKKSYSAYDKWKQEREKSKLKQAEMKYKMRQLPIKERQQIIKTEKQLAQINKLRNNRGRQPMNAMPQPRQESGVGHIDLFGSNRGSGFGQIGQIGGSHLIGKSKGPNLGVGKIGNSGLSLGVSKKKFKL